MSALALALLLAASGTDAGPTRPGVARAGPVDAGAAPAALPLTPLWSTVAPGGPVLSLALSRDGSKLATGSNDKVARLYDAATGKALGELKGARSAISAVAFSADAQRLAVGEGALVVRVYQLPTLKLERELPHPDAVTGLAFSPDGALLAVAGQANTGGVYRLADGKVAWDFTGRSVAFSRDGRQLVAAAGVGALRFWDVAAGKQKRELKTAPHLPWLSADAELATVATWNPAEKELRLWTPAKAEPRVLQGHEKGVFSAALSSDGSRLVSASEDRTLRLWDVASGKPLGHLLIEQLAFVALSADGTLLAVAQGNRVQAYRVGK